MRYFQKALRKKEYTILTQKNARNCTRRLSKDKKYDKILRKSKKKK